MAKTTEIVNNMRQSFRTGKTRPIEWRLKQLNGLVNFLQENKEEIAQALKIDLGKSKFEALSMESSGVLSECKEAIKNLSKWMSPTSVSTPIVHFPASSRIVSDPLGVVLVLGAWNFPLSVTLGPAIGAFAAGNCVVLKPSEIAAASARLLATVLPKYLDADCFAVFEGGPDVAAEVLDQKYDYVFFTGSTRVGKLVYASAAKHLTPVTLELGGKSPVIVDASANLDVAARRLLWGKYVNSGQICIAPDYVMVLRSVQSDLMDAFRKAYAEFFPEGAKASKDYSRIVSDAHCNRLIQFVKEDESKRGEIIVGGEYEQEEKFIAPTIFNNTTKASKLMEEEIFGPLLPCFPVDSLDEAIEFINDRPKPLAAYMFTRDDDNAARLVAETSSGGVVINDVVVHYTVSTLPFGGVGESGIGSYHGKKSFETFSHSKSVLHKSSKSVFDPNLRYPPFDERKQWWFETLL